MSALKFNLVNRFKDDNDEGFHDKYCTSCNKKTEHGIYEGCILCANANLPGKIK